MTMEWIDTSEQLPREYEYVLFEHEGKVMEGWFSKSIIKAWTATRTPGMVITDSVARWMPLPQPKSTE